nr:acyl-CoA dehydrogenase family protein [Nocardia otitidiscaviarum]
MDDLVRAAAADGARWDRDGLPDAMVERAARAGVLGADRPVAFGGAGCDARELGELAATLGHACTSLRSLLTVHGMVAAAVDRWGTAAQRGEWLPRGTTRGGNCPGGAARTRGGPRRRGGGGAPPPPRGFSPARGGPPPKPVLAPNYPLSLRLSHQTARISW